MHWTALHLVTDARSDRRFKSSLRRRMEDHRRRRSPRRRVTPQQHLTSPLSWTVYDGQVLTASSGNCKGQSDRVCLQWRRCDGAVLHDIPAASAKTYSVTSADVGSTIRVFRQCVELRRRDGLIDATAVVTPVGSQGFATNLHGAGVAQAVPNREQALRNDGLWRASMWNSGGQSFHIFRLAIATQTWIDTGTSPTIALGRELTPSGTGATSHVASHVFATVDVPTRVGHRAGSPLQLRPARKDIHPDSGFVAINDTQTTLTRSRQGPWATSGTVQSGKFQYGRLRDRRTLSCCLPPGLGLDTDDISSVVARVATRSASCEQPGHSAVHLRCTTTAARDELVCSRTAVQGRVPLTTTST
jgi:hypothetical protein